MKGLEHLAKGKKKAPKAKSSRDKVTTDPLASNSTEKDGGKGNKSIKDKVKDKTQAKKDFQEKLE